jgi:hypothetical protein
MARNHPQDMTAETVAHDLLTGWLSGFGCTPTISTDQVRPFESQLFQSRKEAIMCDADQHWTEALPLVLLGNRTSFEADLQASVSELVYGDPLMIPGELLTPTSHSVEPAHLIPQLRQHIALLMPVPARHASQVPSYIRFPLTGLNLYGHGASLQRPLPGPISERQDVKTPSASSVSQVFVNIRNYF